MIIDIKELDRLQKDLREWFYNRQPIDYAYKYCPGCDEYLLLTELNFFRNRKSKDGFSKYCIECKRKYQGLKNNIEFLE